MNFWGVHVCPIEIGAAVGLIPFVSAVFAKVRVDWIRLALAIYLVGFTVLALVYVREFEDAVIATATICIGALALRRREPRFILQPGHANCNHD